MELRAVQDEIETISRAYGRLFGVERTDDLLMLKLHEEVGELTQAYVAASGRARRPADPDAVRAELADVLAHVLLLAERFGVDLEAALDDKWFQYRHLVTVDDRARPGVSRSVVPAAGSVAVPAGPAASAEVP